MKKNKTIISLIAIITMLVLALPSLAQRLTVSNVSSSVIVFKMRGESFQHTLAPGANEDATYITPNASSGTAEFYMAIMQGGSITPLGYFSKQLTNGKLLLTESDTKKKGVKNFEALSTYPVMSTPQSAYSTYNSSGGSSNPITRLMPLENATNHRLVVWSSGTFEGAAPGCHKKSLKRFPVSPGYVEISVLYDIDSDSTSTGRNYMQAVVSKIVSEDDTVFTIKESDLFLNLGKEKGIVLHNLSGIKFYFVGQEFQGVSMANEEFWHDKKSILHYGANHYSVQYFNKEGIKVQANMETIISRKDKFTNIYLGDLQKGEKRSGGYKVKN